MTASNEEKRFAWAAELATWTMRSGLYSSSPMKRNLILDGRDILSFYRHDLRRKAYFHAGKMVVGE